MYFAIVPLGFSDLLSEHYSRSWLLCNEQSLPGQVNNSLARAEFFANNSELVL
jgi:hypothetical protein